jgi:hypothetical protein
VHYVTHASPQPGQYARAVVFHSSRQKMDTLLAQYGLVHGGLDDLADGRFTTGDPSDPVGLCSPCRNRRSLRSPNNLALLGNSDRRLPWMSS